MRKLLVLIWFQGLGLGGAGQTTGARSYFPEADSVGGWRTLTGTDDIRLVARLDRSGLDEAFDFVRSTSENGGLLVVRHGYLVYERYFGLGQREATPNLASCGKAFTSLMAGILMEGRPAFFPKGDWKSTSLNSSTQCA